jgi:hypothetical protein
MTDDQKSKVAELKALDRGRRRRRVRERPRRFGATALTLKKLLSWWRAGITRSLAAIGVHETTLCRWEKPDRSRHRERLAAKKTPCGKARRSEWCRWRRRRASTTAPCSECVSGSHAGARTADRARPSGSCHRRPRHRDASRPCSSEAVVIFGSSTRVRVFVYREPVDMRKAYDTPQRPK